VLAKLRTLGVEALAMARQAWLLPRDVTAPVLPVDAREGDDVVVFLHGLFATAGVLRPMRAAVDRHARVHAAAFSYAPGPSVDALVRELAALVAALPPRVRLHLVGHSLGGIVARLYAVRARDAERAVVQTISLASPFAGLRGASAAPFASARDLAPDGAVLREVRLQGAAGVPHLSILAADDALIPAPISQALPHGDVLVVHGIGHNALLFDARVIDAIERRVLSSRRVEAGDAVARDRV
jgi:pimeloyl-ACP methyl ester carboxylesterase